MKIRDIVNEVRDPEDWDEGNTEPANNFAVYINGKKWKVFKGRGYYADDFREREHYRQLQSWAQKKSDATGKKWTVHVTGEPATESIAESASEGATSSGNIATVTSPHLAIGSARGNKSYTGSPGKSGTKAPKPPKTLQKKNADGTAKNALDMKNNIFGGGSAIKR
jgi:hypothetical protein